MKKKLKRFAIAYLLVGSLVFILHLTGCASAKFTEYRRSFQANLPKEMMRGDCVFRGTTNLSGNVFLRYDLHDFVHWDKHAPNMAYLVPQSQGSLAVEKTNLPIRHEDLNAGFVFYSDGTQAYLQDVIQQMKSSEHPVYTSILLVCATQNGKGTRVSFLSKEDSQWVESGPHVIDLPVQDNPWWVSTLPAGYLVTVPVDVVTFPIQAPFLIFGYVLGRGMSPM